MTKGKANMDWGKLPSSMPAESVVHRKGKRRSDLIDRILAAFRKVRLPAQDHGKMRQGGF